MESYFNAKSKLFDLLDKSSKKSRVGIVNADDEYCLRILDRKLDGKYSYPIYSFALNSSNNKADYMPKENSIENKITGLSYIMQLPQSLQSQQSPKKEVNISLAIAGSFHVYNSLAAFAVADCLGIKSADICKGFSALKSVPGRFDVINSKLGFSVIVDYAHTGDALLKLLVSVNDIHHSRIITVFGCGGDRDKTKRPVMGRIASENSDFVIVTSDNPRTEDPLSIINDILVGVDSLKCKIIPDRREAISAAIETAQSDDIIVIAGKGHENYQILGKTKIKFDDHEIAHECIDSIDNKKFCN
jgi:UDP-N-acetylmuramoyl-L-alanyl-D-glutamate--2,6-diaminopimelate ligase